MGNVFTLKSLSTQIMNEYLTNRNMTKIFGLIGQLTYTALSINSELMLEKSGQLSWIETNPLEADPMNATYWITVESIYELLQASKFVSEPTLDYGFEATENFLLEFSSLISYLKVNDTRNVIFAFSDMLFYTHNMTVGLHDSFFEVLATFSKINTQVFGTSGVLLSNVISNLFWIISDVNAIWAQIYYLDIINLGKVVGDLNYRIFASSLQ